MKTTIKYIKQNYKLVAVVLVLGILLGFFIGKPSTNQHINTSTHQHIEQSTHQIWTCSMHPQIRMDEPGQCPICSMDLIPLESTSSGDEAVDPDAIEMSESAMKLAEVQTMPVKKDYSNKKVYLLGKVKPDERNIAELTARFGGRIEKLFVNFTGQNVRKGEKLATIYSPELVTAQKELLEAVEYKETNPSFYKATRNKLKLWDLTDAQINAIEEGGEPQTYFDVLSPITGTVTMRHVAVGDYIKEGNALLQVVNLTKLWVMFEAYESDLPWLNTGDRVEFTVQSLPGEKFNGRVTYIDPFLDPKTRVAYVRVEVSNPNLELKPEMFANGIIKPTLTNNKKDLLIPKTAVLWTGKRSVVYVKLPEREHPTFKYREIVLGPEAGDFYVVKDGLSEGEEIAVNGVFKIDAAAQLEGKPSMMNPKGGKVSTGHDHGSMGGDSQTDHSAHKETDTKEKEDHSGHDAVNANMQMEEDHASHTMTSNLEHAMFKVSGNCSMCKNRIEKAANAVEGVNSAVWDVDTKEIHISYNHDKTSLNAIHKAIANAGHDTEKESAPQAVYDDLPPCCQYSR